MALGKLGDEGKELDCALNRRQGMGSSACHPIGHRRSAVAHQARARQKRVVPVHVAVAVKVHVCANAEGNVDPSRRGREGTDANRCIWGELLPQLAPARHLVPVLLGILFHRLPLALSFCTPRAWTVLVLLAATPTAFRIGSASGIATVACPHAQAAS